MSETLSYVQSLAETSPESEGRAAFLQERELVRKFAWESNDWGIEASVALPEIVGYVPEEERELFSTLKSEVFTEHIDGYGSTKRWGLTADFVQAFPGITNLILGDLTSFHGSKPSMEDFEMEIQRYITQSGNTPNSPGWHVDYFNARKGKDFPVDYLVSDCLPTEFSEGSVRLNAPPRSGYKAEDLVGFRGRVREVTKPEGVAAPDFAIVRLSPITIHRSPTFPVTKERTFARITFKSA